MEYEDYCDMVADSIKDEWDELQDLYDYQQEERDLRCE